MSIEEAQEIAHDTMVDAAIEELLLDRADDRRYERKRWRR